MRRVAVEDFGPVHKHGETGAVVVPSTVLVIKDGHDMPMVSKVFDRKVRPVFGDYGVDFKDVIGTRNDAK